MMRGKLVAISAAWLLGSVALAGAARAACTTDPCVAGGSASFDCDRDGLTDLEECGGLTSAGGAAFAFPSCRVTPAAQPECLDPTVSDLFVKFEKVAASAYTELGISNADAFSFITQAVSAGGLAVRVHILDATQEGALLSTPQPNSVTSRQPAVRVKEVRGTSTACPITAPLGAVNGVTSVGGSSLAQIFTQRIIDHVGCVYGTANANSAAAIADKVKMIKHTTSHETTHLMRLAPESVDAYGGHHYRAGSGCVMDQASTYTTKGGVKFATPVKYCGPDQAAVSAGETALGKIQCEDPSNTLDQDNFTNSCLPATP